jgi:hypothetical protein
MLLKRVVDVGNEPSSLVRLHISKAQERGQYAALSHCWGGEQAAATTIANLRAQTQGIPTQSLRATILDAIKVTRGTGLRYLWVDTLCIVQDDSEDKHTGISTMGSIYKNATFTIAAFSAERASEGFLFNSKADQPIVKLPLISMARHLG